ncbi:hypothetical protein K469DRAFT_721449 [Zopfia rhizophila CBS 207.26]|uniref:CENP-V/GFA domain-containing protein n=1 Tax=Zopfia rhizophila CBS 207.26 TaxID=1314779 RepID=A0A6A6EIS5_9PEZI|nr:hypothetical protein K469DRAFT_721449 [Zopfia rhizophila CBS 207.26]
MSDEGFPHMPKFDSIESQTYDASCHCGTVQFTVTLAPPLAKQKPVSCNCSICSRNGYLLVYPLREQLNVMSGEGALRDYAFGRKRNRHKFCSKCGSSVFFDPRMAEYGEEPDLLGVNVSLPVTSQEIDN